MSSLAHVIPPEAAELQIKRQELSELEQELTEKELHLSTVKGELHLFERQYNQRVGAKYAELDEVRAQVLELATRFYPRSDTFQAGARNAREQARKFAEDAEEAEGTPLGETQFNPSENLKKLYREVAKQIHPDLSADAEDKVRRHELMARLNRAYDRLDGEAIRSIQVAWEAQDSTDPQIPLPTRLVRTVRQIAQVRKRLDSIDRELDRVKQSGLFRLLQKVREAGNSDLLEEMAREVDEKILHLKSRIRDLVDELE